MNNKKLTGVLAVLTAAMLAVQLLLFLVSWLVAAMMPETAVHSLLSNEGIRWFFGSFVENVASPLLVWLLVIAMAWGVMADTRFFQDMSRLSSLPYRPKFAFQFVAFELALFVVVLVMTALVPHAPLLSVTGQLFPSSFSKSLVPIIAFCLIVMGVTYGLLSGKMKSLFDVFLSVSGGVRRVAPLVFVYVVAVELFYSFMFVFGS